MEEDENPLRPPPLPIHQPSPRRPATFSITPLSPTSSEPSKTHTPSLSDTSEHQARSGASTAQAFSSGPSGASSMTDTKPDDGRLTQKTRSIVNLTSSTLFGIYSPSGYDTNRDEPSTPLSSGAQTPHKNDTVDFRSGRIPAPETLERARQQRFNQQDQIRKVRSISESHHVRPISRARRTSGLLWRAAVLFCMGLGYGEFVTQLHDTQEIAPVQIEGINRRTWSYLIGWGIAAVVIGGLLPWMDQYWGSEGLDESAVNTIVTTDKKSFDMERSESEPGVDDSDLGADWNPIVRTIGAFVGIAFAIRRLPWQSTMQVSLTLALVNPAIWYLIDRSKTGFALSSVFGLCGAAALLGINPDIVPSPASSPSTPNMIIGSLSYESVGVATWITSVLFCSCVCFGNLGRRLSRPDRMFP